MNALRFVERCMDEYAERAWRMAYVMLSNVHDADDLLQQAFIVAWRKADQAPSGDAWPWLAAIIAGEAYNYRRKRARRQAAPLSAAGDQAMESRHQQELEQAELHALIHLALNELSAEQRIAIVLTHLSGLTQQQAADALGIPLNTLKARVRRGMEKLQGIVRASLPSLEKSLLALPILLPAGGLAAAKAGWLTTVSKEATLAATAATNIGAGGFAAFAVGAVLCIGLAAMLLLPDPPENPANKTGVATNPTTTARSNEARVEGATDAQPAEQHTAAVDAKAPEIEAPTRAKPAEEATRADQAVERVGRPVDLPKGERQRAKSGQVLFFGEPVAGKVVFLIDMSATMGGERWAGVREELLSVLNQVSTQTTFELMAYSGALDGAVRLRHCFGTMTEATDENLDTACEWVQKLTPGGGGSPLYPALQQACSRYRHSASQMFLVADSGPNMAGTSSRLLSDFPAWWGQGRWSELVVVSIGGGGENFLRSLARLAGGTFIKA